MNGIKCAMRMTGSFVLFLGVSTGALAQSMDGERIDEIVVTAQRKAGSLQDTAIAITAFSQSMLEDRQITRTEFLADYVPNLFLTDGVSNQSTLSVTLRGRGEQAGGVATSESGVAFYSDDVYQARLSGTNAEFIDVERIEVLRGPQGTLFGRNSMTGAINVISVTPGDELFARASVSYGSYDEVRLRAVVGGPLVEGALAASISALYQNQMTGWKTNANTGEEVDTRSSHAVRGQLHYYGGDVVDARIIGFYNKAENSGFLPTAIDRVTQRPLTGDLRRVQQVTPSLGDTENWGVSADVKFALGSVTLRSITAYGETQDAFRWDFTGGLTRPNGSVVAGFDRNSFYTQNQFSQELQLTGGSDTSFVSWIVGAYYFKESVEQTVRDRVFNLGLQGFVNAAIDYEGNTKSYAGFGEVTVRPLPKLELVAGLRYSRDDKNIAGLVSPLFQPVNQVVPFTKASFGSWTPRFLVNYRASNEVFLYGSVSKGFRAGGFNGFSGNVLGTATPFRPENVWAYEVGGKFDLFDRRLRLNVAAFRNEFTDLQTATLLPGTANIVTGNGANYRLNGVEAELTVTPVKGLQLFASLGLQDQAFTFIDPSAQLANFVPPPRQLGNSPNATASAGFNFELPINYGLKLRFGSDFVYRASSFANVENRPLQQNSSVERLNGFIAVATEDDRWALTVSGRNITNAVDWVNGFDLPFLNAASRHLMDPRMVQVELRFRY
jgi:iron complex outermembrane receptor protein